VASFLLIDPQEDPINPDNMCGRFSLVVPERFFSKVFVFKDLPEMHPDYNISPGVDIWGARNKQYEEQPEMVKLRWGLVPSWAKNPKIGYRMINARSETVAEKPAFRSAFKRRRCVIAADGFFEWKREGKERTPYFIHLKNKEPFGMAGLWEKWTSEEGDELQTCTILTTTPNSLMEPLHDRMPVILANQDLKPWLSGDTRESELLELTAPYPAKKMDAYSITSLVNSPRNNAPELLEKLEIPQQEELF
tara:strand:- start:1550 stop:2296 length:747 start_codon:yes stop_codon:yes gene_type:complete